MNDMWRKKGFGLLSTFEAEKLDPFKHPGIKYSDLPKQEPFVESYLERIQKEYQHLREKGVTDPKEYFKKSDKIKKEFYDELIKKYPKEKNKLKTLRKELDDFRDIKLRYRELLQIGTRRHLTDKEVREIENMSKKLKGKEKTKWE